MSDESQLSECTGHGRPGKCNRERRWTARTGPREEHNRWVMNLDQLSTHLERRLRPGVPKYVSLQEAFVDAIVSGVLQPGDKVPNEQELADALPMSLGTIQRALRELANTGVVDRRPGLGSFIRGATGKGEMAHPFHCRFLSEDQRGYLPVFPEPLSRQLQTDLGDWSLALHASQVIQIDRRIRISNEFNVHTAFFVDAARLPIFLSTPLEDLAHFNFKDVIFKSCGQAVTTIDLRTRQEVPAPEVLKILGSPDNTTCLSIRATGFLNSRDAIYYQHIHIPPTHRELHIIADSRANGLLDY